MTLINFYLTPIDPENRKPLNPKQLAGKADYPDEPGPELRCNNPECDRSGIDVGRALQLVDKEDPLSPNSYRRCAYCDTLYLLTVEETG